LSHDLPAVRPLADRQRDVLNTIVRFFVHTGEHPSVCYVARRLGIHHKTVQQHIEALYRKGYLSSPSPQGMRCPHER
jgi:Mn-dependent DtxR family transcriptional regulator